MADRCFVLLVDEDKTEKQQATKNSLIIRVIGFIHCYAMKFTDGSLLTFH